MLTLNNGVHRAGLLAVATVDALGHIDIVTGRPAASIHTLFRLNGNGLGRADGLAKLAGNAALFTGGITTQSVLSTETGGDGTLLEGVQDSVTIMRKRGLLGHLKVIEAWYPELGETRLVYWDIEGWYSRWAEKLLDDDVHAAEHLHEQEVLGGTVHSTLSIILPGLLGGQAEARLRGTGGCSCANGRGREVCGRTQRHEGGATRGNQPGDLAGGCHGGR